MILLDLQTIMLVVSACISAVRYIWPLTGIGDEDVMAMATVTRYFTSLDCSAASETGLSHQPIVKPFLKSESSYCCMFGITQV